MTEQREESWKHQLVGIVTRKEYLGYVVGATSVFVSWALPDNRTIAVLVMLVLMFYVMPLIRKHGS